MPSTSGARPRQQLFRKFAAALVAVAVLGVAAVFTYSSFADTTVNGENTFSAGKLGLRDNDASAPMFTVAGMGATETRERCIVVENAGNQTFDELRLYGTVAGPLADHLTLRVDRGTGATTFSDCGGFVPDASPTLYNGPLTGYPSAWDGAIVDPAPEFVPNQTMTYRFRVSTNDAPQAAQGQQAEATFKWEARQGDEPTHPPNELHAGESIPSGQLIRSPDGNYSLVMQPDGNLVYAEAPWQLIWYSGTHLWPGVSAHMQQDGNFVVHDGGPVVWQTNTPGNPGAYLDVGNGYFAIRDASGGIIRRYP